MHYSILTGEIKDARFEFLTEETREKLKKQDGWVVIGQDEDE